MQTYQCSRCKQKVSRSDLLEHRKACGPAEMELRRGVGGRLAGALKACLLLFVALMMAGASILLGMWSFESLAEMRQLERIPAVSVRGVLEGEVNLNGRGRRLDAALSAPSTGTACLIYRYVVERQERDSDGDTRWRTIRDETRFVPFLLEDDTGSVRVEPAGRARIALRQSWSQTRGDMRYTEYRLEPGDSLFLFGFAERDARGAFTVGFERDGYYSPILSVFGETSERATMAGGSIAKVWFGVVVLAIGLSLVISVLRIHRLLVYFSILNVLVAIYMVVLGLNMMKLDLESAMERLAQHERRTGAEIARMFGARNIAWDGGRDSLAAMDARALRGLTEEEAARVREIRVNLAVAIERVRHQRSAFPEFLLAPLWGIAEPEALPLSAAESEEFESREVIPETAKVPPLVGLILIGISLVVGFATFFTGFRRVRFKRCMENLPTSPTTGAVWGLAEFKGVVDVAAGADLLKGPLSAQPCIQYHYKIEERRGSGKKARWVTVLDQHRRIPFLVRDEEGSLLVDPAGAKVYTSHSSRRSRLGRRYSETRLEYGDPLYAIGECRVEPVSGEKLYLSKPRDDYPFILSNFTEQQVMLKVARSGIALLNVSFAAILLTALLLFGLSGSFAATDYLAAALTAPFFMTAVTLMLHYNDLVFLRERVRRNQSNIDVSLKKRHDLVPQLENITRALTEHERQIQEGLTEMRSLYTQKVDRTPEGLQKHLQAEHGLLQQMLMRVEANPSLVADKQTALMMRTLILLENEAALMRKGYNDAVETYNTRIAVFPDVLFARMFGFKEAVFHMDGGAVLHVPPSVQAVWERAQTPPPPPIPTAHSPAAEGAEPDVPADTGDTPASAAALAAAAGYEAEGEERAVEEALCDRLLALFEHEPAEPLAALDRIEALYPEMRELTPAAYRTLRRRVVEAVEADDRLTFFEWALLQSMTRQVDAGFGLKPEHPLRYRNFDAITGPVSKLLSLIARTEATPDTARAAYDEGVANLNHPKKQDFTLMEVDPQNLQAFEEVVEELAHAAPMIRANVYYACDAAVRRGNTFTVEQQLLLIALADAFERPRPSF
ncbi:MAG: LemA family protein [Verrucomicrobia bacterium]|nr:LemA family protein [Verrucomicrobiota bacterium]